MEFWLDKIIRQTRIPYPIFFGLIGLFLYLLGIPFMIVTDNLLPFLSEPRWILVAIFGAICGVSVIFVYRRFSDSINEIKHLFESKDKFQKTKDKLMGRLTNKVYWIIVVFWIAMNSLVFTESMIRLFWWRSYHQPYIISSYYFIEALWPVILLSSIFTYMIPFGLTWAYRDLCLRTSFKKDALVSEWMEPFKGFKNLITLTMFAAVVYSLFPLVIWSPTMKETAWGYVPYVAIVIVLIPTVLLPHYYFHKLFSKVKENRLKDFRNELLKFSTRRKKDIPRRTLLLLEALNTEQMKTMLIDVRTLVEILIVALMHVSLVEVVATLIHG
ncbi:MAG: hypothetical protein NWF08_00930 [Candidatus Bathyarchaeota archaeon]|nr:hypothetical protein [Candidatus Bathyarchaeota archaeon]